tara:strand:+ start:1012 stop:1452 length:441 start_codon:yes stop_codon:yes gene_type:complete
MSLNFDLNIKNYTLVELRKLLNLEMPFSEDEIIENSDNIKNKIINDDTLSKDKKEKLLKFILKTETILKLDLEQYFFDIKNNNFINNRDFLKIPEIDIEPNNNDKFTSWPKGAAVLYYNKAKKLYQIYVKNTFSGIEAEWSIFNSQ